MNAKEITGELISERPQLQFVASSLVLVLTPSVTWSSHLQESAHSFLKSSEKTKSAFLLLLLLVLTIDETQNHTDVLHYVLP